MAVACLSNASQTNIDHGSRYTRGNTRMDHHHHARDDHQRRQGPNTPPQPTAIPIATVMTANENWHGKNDPTERRRIQNRLNQRAFRQRQRAGEQSKQYKPRSTSSASDSKDDDASTSSSEDESESPQARHTTPFRQYGASGTAATSSGERPEGLRDPQGRIWDELAQLINRNFMAAVVSNAQQLGLDLAALRSTTPLTTPKTSSSPGVKQVPASLKPVELQHQVAHDPVIDTIPHARFRFNVLRGIVMGQVDATAFSRCIRGSGALEEVASSAAGGDGGCTWQRSGLVVWSNPESIESWELSEPFVKRWAALLAGCEELIAATNAWRSRRGERTFSFRVG